MTFLPHYPLLRALLQGLAILTAPVLFGLLLAQLLLWLGCGVAG